MKFFAIALTSFFVTSLGQASPIVCQGHVDFYGQVQSFQVKIDGDGIGQANQKSTVRTVEVSGSNLAKANVFLTVDDYWDGHSSGLITAPGFSMLYEQSFGCIRNAIVTTDFRGDVTQEGSTVGHIIQSQLIPLCDNGNQFCK